MPFDVTYPEFNYEAVIYYSLVVYAFATYRFLQQEFLLLLSVPDTWQKAINNFAVKEFYFYIWL